MSSNKNSFGWDFLFTDNCDYGNNTDGSEGYKYSDGSGYFTGADGSEGYKYSDGSGYFKGADGSEGYRYSDGSGYYRGADGSDGYIYSDGSGYYNGSDGTSVNFDARKDGYAIDSDSDQDDEDSSHSSSTDWLGMGASLLGVAAIYAVQTSAERKREQERILEEKRKERRAYIKENWQDILSIVVVFGTFFLLAAEYGIYRLLVNTETVSAESISESMKALFGLSDPDYFLQSLFYFRWQWLAIIALAIVIGLMAFLILKMRRSRKMREFGFAQSDLIGSDYKSVIERLKRGGFSVVTTEAIKDLSASESGKIGEVARVSIEGKTTYTCYSRFPFDAPIIVYYRTRQDIMPPVSSAGCVNANYSEIEQRFRAAGFTEIHIEPVLDLINGWLTKDGSIKQITIDGKESFSKRTRFSYDANVIIRYHTFKKKK